MQFDSMRQEMADALDAFEVASGFQVCFRELSDRWEFEGRSVGVERYEVHRSDFCMSWKEKTTNACVRCDNNELLPACSPRSGRRLSPFVRTCHAGADEVLVPIWSMNVLVAVLFVGQFTFEGGSVEELEVISGVERMRLISLARPLQAYLVEILARVERLHVRSGRGKRAVIEHYIREQLVNGPTVAGLAARLNLSTSRTGHVVREETGSTFSAVVERERLAVAADLLRRSDSTIAAVGRQAGFSDPSYFTRYFKLKTGQTPGDFRAGAERSMRA